jgi:hypothetical protein
MPEEIITDKDGPVMGVDLAQELAFALATIKELHEEMRELQQRVDTLSKGRDK